MNQHNQSTFDKTFERRSAQQIHVPPVVSSRLKSKSVKFEGIETQLRRLEYRLIILSLIQGQGRPYLNRIERMQYEEILQQLNQAFKDKLKRKHSSKKAAALDKNDLSQLDDHQIEYWMERFSGALKELDKEPCDLCAQNTLQETGKQLIPLIRNQLVVAAS
ncbi:MAG: hypothetical protein K2X66_05085 [Cyanobacteria bacterium]|nr:hypothetical protein [Cyanobacteriota bacterium]